MTQPAEPTTVPDPADNDAATSTNPGEAPPAKPGGEPDPSPNSEAARYRVERNEARTERNEARTERDALAERLTGCQRRECEAAVADLLDVPADLWEVGQADVTAFYNDDGTVNEAELRAAAGALIEMRPRLAKPQRAPSQWGQNSGATPTDEPEVGWGTVISRP